MICPHCRASLLRKERTGSKCTKCRKKFVLDPKGNRLRLHDLRVRALVASLSAPARTDGPPLSFTVDQLRHAAARKVLAEPPTVSLWLGCTIPVGVLLVVVLIGVGIAGTGAQAAPVLLGTGLVFGGLVLGHVLTANRRRYPGLPVSAPVFESYLRRWEGVYGARPDHLLPPRRAVVVPPAAPPRSVLLCTDPGIVLFLAEAGTAQRWPVVLVPADPTPDDAPPGAVLRAVHEGLPVLVLHGADPAGCLVVPRLRAALPGARVLDAGLRPRVGRNTGPAVRVRPPESLLAELRTAVAHGASPLTDDELGWLAEGCTTPLAAVHPRRLLHAVERAVDRVVNADPAARQARELGFLAPPEVA